MLTSGKHIKKQGERYECIIPYLSFYVLIQVLVTRVCPSVSNGFTIVHRFLDGEIIGNRIVSFPVDDELPVGS